MSYGRAQAFPMVGCFSLSRFPQYMPRRLQVQVFVINCDSAKIGNVFKKISHLALYQKAFRGTTVFIIAVDKAAGICGEGGSATAITGENLANSSRVIRRALGDHIFSVDPDIRIGDSLIYIERGMVYPVLQEGAVETLDHELWHCYEGKKGIYDQQGIKALIKETEKVVVEYQRNQPTGTSFLVLATLPHAIADHNLVVGMLREREFIRAQEIAQEAISRVYAVWKELPPGASIAPQVCQMLTATCALAYFQYVLPFEDAAPQIAADLKRRIESYPLSQHVGLKQIQECALDLHTRLSGYRDTNGFLAIPRGSSVQRFFGMVEASNLVLYLPDSEGFYRYLSTR